MKHSSVKRAQAAVGIEPTPVTSRVEIYEHPPVDDREPALKIQTDSRVPLGPAVYSVPQLRSLLERLGPAGTSIQCQPLPAQRYELHQVADSLEAASAWLQAARPGRESYVVTPGEPTGIRAALPMSAQSLAVIAELWLGNRDRERLYVTLLPWAPELAVGYVIRAPAQLPHPAARAAAR